MYVYRTISFKTATDGEAETLYSLFQNYGYDVYAEDEGVCVEFKGIVVSKGDRFICKFIVDDTADDLRRVLNDNYYEATIAYNAMGIVILDVAVPKESVHDILLTVWEE